MCNVPVSTASIDSHKNGRKHQYYLRTLEHIENSKKCGVVVSGFPKDHGKELTEYFRQFGRIIISHYTSKCLIIKYREQFAAEKVLSIQHYFMGKNLKVRRFVPKENQNSERSSEHTLDLYSISQSLQNIDSIDQQIAVLMGSVRPEFPVTLEKYKTVCRDLEMCLKKDFSACKVHAFGSTITGLCFKDSDVDIYVELPEDVLNQCRPDMPLKVSRKALHRFPKLFNHIISIPRARTPIIRCVHVPTNISCDFNFKSMMGVYNSRLISYYLSLDPKLTPLMYILKFWGKVHALSGPQKFTNYALTIMMIFYLQHPPFSLPTVYDLQKNCIYLQEGWNCGFSPIENFHNDALNNASVMQLLGGFFSFYLNFDYALYVICPLLGKEITKLAFFTPKSLPESFGRYKSQADTTSLQVDSSVCVQDPFQLNRNVTGVVELKVLEWFVACCKQGADLCRLNTESNFLFNLFTVSPMTNEHRSETVCFMLRMDKGLKVLYDSMAPESRSINAIRKAWYESVNTFLLSVLTLVFKLDVDAKPTPSSSKSIKLDGQKDVHDNNTVDTIVFHCTGSRNLWEQRKSWAKNINLDLPENTDLLTRETALTDYICKDSIELTKDLVEFDLLVAAKVNPTSVEFEMKRTGGVKSAFHSLCSFLVGNFVYWFNNTVCKKQSSPK